MGEIEALAREIKQAEDLELLRKRLEETFSGLKIFPSAIQAMIASFCDDRECALINTWNPALKNEFCDFFRKRYVWTVLGPIPKVNGKYTLADWYVLGSWHYKVYKKDSNDEFSLLESVIQDPAYCRKPRYSIWRQTNGQKKCCFVPSRDEDGITTTVHY